MANKSKERKVTKILLRVPEDLADQYRELAEATGVSATQIYNYVLRNGLSDAKTFAEFQAKLKSGEIGPEDLKR
jgi:hypothetical protein